MKVSKSASKYNNFTIIPKNVSKKKIFIDLLKRKKIRFATIGNEREDFKDENNINYNKSIPKVPQKEKNIIKSEKVKKHESKLNEIKNQNFNESKRRFLLFNRFSRVKSCDYNLCKMNLKTNFDNDNNINLVSNFKNKLENIKKKTKRLLQFYADNKIRNINLNAINNE